MKQLKALALLLAIAVSAAWAQRNWTTTAMTAADGETIRIASTGALGTLNVPSGATVTIVSDGEEPIARNAVLNLSISTGATVKWEAKIAVSGTSNAVSLGTSTGTFEVQPEAIIRQVGTAAGNAVVSTGAGRITVLDGEISAAGTGVAINSTNNTVSNIVTVSGGVVSAVTGRAIVSSTNGVININGGLVIARGTAIFGNSTVNNNVLSKAPNHTGGLLIAYPASGAYILGTRNGLTSLPVDADILWAKNNEANGIQFNGCKFFIICEICNLNDIVLVAESKKPFPQAVAPSESDLHGIRPNRPQNQMNLDVSAKYRSYRTRFLKTQQTNRGLRAWINATGTQGSGTATISEAHGYGMKIFALMSGVNGDEQYVFDAMNALRRDMPSSIDNRLMSWLVYPADITNPPTHPQNSNATDGCLDMAYALLLADTQWGSNPASGHAQNYLEQARRIIAGLKASNMHQEIFRTKLGDWQGSEDASYEANTTTSRSSDWRPAHFRAFYKATGDIFWNIAADTVYGILQSTSNANTGLMPDFVIGNPARAVIASSVNPHPEALVHGESNQHNFSFNACRVPWFLAMDYVHYGTQAAMVRMNRITVWLNSQSRGVLDNFYIGYGFLLNGNRINSRDEWSHMAFVASFASGMMGSSGNAAFLNNTYTYINNIVPNDEYAAAIQLLNMLLITGNWWAPISAVECTHDFGDWTWKVSKEATCTESGIKTGTRICSVCGETDTDIREITVLPHSWADNWTITTSPTCEAQGVETRICTNENCTHPETRQIAQLTGEACQNSGNVSIRNPQNTDNMHGIILENAIVTDKAQMRIILPNGERVASVSAVIYDNLGNTVFTKSVRRDNFAWNLTNSAGRFVANGTYLIIAEARSANGKIYRYSARIGVNR